MQRTGGKCHANTVVSCQLLTIRFIPAKRRNASPPQSSLLTCLTSGLEIGAKEKYSQTPLFHPVLSSSPLLFHWKFNTLPAESVPKQATHGTSQRLATQQVCIGSTAALSVWIWDELHPIMSLKLTPE
jgi:hypothetical protein